MKKNKIIFFVKIAVLVFLLTLIGLAGFNIYHYLSLAQKTDEEMVKSYRTTLEVESIKKAAEILSGQK